MEDYGQDGVEALGREEALQRVSTPALLLLIFGILCVVLGLGGVVVGFAMRDSMKEQQQQEIENLRETAGEEAAQQYESMMGYMEAFQNPLLNLVGVAVSIFIILGALKMKKLESKGMAMGAAIVAMVPCLTPCCLLGIPVGVWCLVVMGKDEVSSHFN